MSIHPLAATVKVLDEMLSLITDPVALQRVRQRRKKAFVRFACVLSVQKGRAVIEAEAEAAL